MSTAGTVPAASPAAPAPATDSAGSARSAGRLDPAAPPATNTRADAPLPTALDWRRSCRLIGLGEYRIPLSDAVLTALLLVVVAADSTLVTTWGPHPAYVLNTLVAVAVAAAQPFRHRAPVASGVAVYLAMVAYVVLLRFTPVSLGLSPVIVAVPAALHALARWAPDRRWGVVALLAALVGAVINPQTVYSFNPHTAHMFNYPPFGFSLACVLVVTSTYLGALRRRAAAESVDRAVAAAARLAAAQAVSAERLTIARELHDLVGHGLTVVKVQADTGLALGTPEAARESLTAVRDASAAALASTRELVALLRSSSGPGALAPAADLTGLPALVEQARGTGMEVKAALPDAAELATWNGSWTALQRLTLNRVVSEGLTNAVRHGCGTAHLTVAAQGGRCEVRVTNPQPRGDFSTVAEGERGKTHASHDGPGHGLTGMAERLRLAGGHLEAGPSGDGAYFLLSAVFPVASTPDVTRPGAAAPAAAPPGQEQP
ncbi:two-component sensor histidine kinase [Actinomyces sp. 594]|uniref:sensor histidine kinase n=1 Tax=Actinomyces sp. 594 TaxID=2057793 RepID=UPI001C592172|nr:histidine kinase [Actinomyces sp. 594]MBW3069545.1 two-component sensor histidine kinase [Actinomyces sp. 594]